MKALDVPLVNEVADALSAVRMMAQRSGDDVRDIAVLIERIYRLMRVISYGSLVAACAQEVQREKDAVDEQFWKMFTERREEVIERFPGCRNQLDAAYSLMGGKATEAQQQ